MTSVEIGWRMQVFRSSRESQKLEIGFRIAWSENRGPNQISMEHLWLFPNSTILTQNMCIAKGHQTFILRPKNSGHSSKKVFLVYMIILLNSGMQQGTQSLMDSCSAMGSYSSTNSV